MHTNYTFSYYIPNARIHIIQQYFSKTEDTS